MQGVTHLITGIFLQETTNKLRPAFLRYFLIALLAIISHGLLDKLGILTYHPPMPLIYDWFWLVYHFLLVWPITLYILIKYVRHYWFVFLFSVLPDFDWLISSLVKFFSLSFPFGQEAILH
ncbi:MAG: hypothetical protein N2259_00795, partial [Patescibacteria group bacterium]|nr:hypothetical protein [Patescibacteria group bacterium]